MIFRVNTQLRLLRRTFSDPIRQVTHTHTHTHLHRSWHTHVPPSLLLAQLNARNDETSPQIGWMYDGFPVYGPRGPNGVMLTRCSESEPSTPCLDSCNGYEGSWTLSDGTNDGYLYRYFITGPYVLIFSTPCLI